MKKAFAILAFVVTALALAIGQWQIAQSLFGNSLGTLIDVVNGVLTGHPPWPNYQDRILGPAIYAVIRGATHQSDAGAFQWTVILLLWVFFCIHGLCAWRVTRSVQGTALVVLASFALNALLMQTPWLYLWDLVDLSVFSLLTWALIAGRPSWVILAIVAVEAFNREVAVILSLAFLCEGFIHWRETRKVGRTLTGLALCIGVYAVILGIRRALLVEATMPRTLASPVGQGFLSSFFLNLREVGNLVTNTKNLLWQMPHWLLVLWIAARLGWEGIATERRRAALWLGAVFLAVWAVGYVVEWRVWLDFVPYVTLVLGAASVRTPDGAVVAGRDLPLPAGRSEA